MSARAWLAEPAESEPVAALLVEFRDWHRRDWPSANAFLASVERLIETPDAEFLLASPDDDSPPAGRVPAALPPLRVDGGRRLLAGGRVRA